ncbi:CU044_5270 family protein [Streptomyces sp. NPDC048643]|uniref:CU044_5270 family protein n=1 Tax=Streptomyces sp. NPDC048643 TaxID=3155637 RepID=UPI00344AB71D
MADELDLLRRANPVPADDPRFHDRPLDPGAERRLRVLTRTGREHPARTGRPPHLGRLLDALRPRRPRDWAWTVTAAAAVGAVVLALTLSGPGTVPAVAAPRPLIVETGSAPLPLDVLADRAAAQGAGLRLRQGTHVQTWSLSMTSGPGARPPVTLPEERVVRWAPDGSHTELVVATDPRHPGKPVVTDADPVPRTVEDGHVISRQTYPPSWSDAPPSAEPPHDARRLRAYLEEIDRLDAMDTPGLLDAVSELLANWTLGSRETAALTRVLAEAPGLRPVGAVTDRLGRPGQAYVYDDKAHAVRRMLILDPATGSVLGLEDTVTRGEREYGVKAGDVMSYSAWLR